MQRAATLNRRLQLSNISIFELSGQRTPHSVPGAGEPNLSFSLELESPACLDGEGEVFAVFPVLVKLEQLEGTERHGLAVLRVGVHIVYAKDRALDEGEAAALEDYVGIVGWMHAWPYVRAEIQALSVKLGFPPLVLPVLLAGQTADIEVRKLVSERAPAAIKAAKSASSKKSTRKPRKKASPA